jgi:hypothetical protein
MSWSFAVPATAPADFETAASAAKAGYEQQLSDNDYALQQAAAAQAQAAIDAAVTLVNSGTLGDGLVSGQLSGHARGDGASPYSTVAVSLSCAPIAAG